MRIQVIHAHPLPDSYNRALFDLVLATLREGGHEVTATDLYGNTSEFACGRVIE